MIITKELLNGEISVIVAALLDKSVPSTSELRKMAADRIRQLEAREAELEKVLVEVSGIIAQAQSQNDQLRKMIYDLAKSDPAASETPE